nr:unnamed protein product [Spirometra erinaceieuropaei]
MVDQLMEMRGFSNPFISALSTTPASPISQLEIELSKLADDIASLQKPAVSSSSRSQPKPSTPHVQSSHLARPKTAVTCWYRTTFGAKAHRCICLCSFTFKQSKRVKPVSRKVSAVNLPDSSNPGRTFYVRDTRSGRHFLVDTGAQKSVIPPTSADRLCPNPGLFLQAVNTSPSTTFDTCSLYLDIGLQVSFPLGLLQISSPLCDLLVDCLQSRLHYKTTNLTVQSISSSDASRQLAVLDPEPENPYRQLLAKYIGLTRPNFSASVPPHDVVHHIRTTGPPVFSRPRRLAPARPAAAKAEFEHRLQMDIIRQSKSQWASPLYMVLKVDTGDWRPCDDYRALNNITVPDRFPVQHLQDFAGALFGKSVFSNIDVFLCMLFGLRNASQTFQRFVDRVLLGLPFVYAYIDDPLVASYMAEEEMENLAKMFDRLKKFGVVLNPSKCVFGVSSLEFLGHLGDSYGIHPLPSKFAAIRGFPRPSSKRQLQRFLGMVSFYCRFLLHCAHTILPLSSLLSGRKPFSSRKLSPAETRYSIFRRELLAAFLAVKQFRHFLEGRDFTVFMDHKPLSFALKSTPHISHIDGSCNEAADALSRPSIAHHQLSPGIDLADMAAEQRRVGSPCDEDVSGLQLQDLPLTTGNGIILCDVSTTFQRPFEPPSLRHKVFSLHYLSHPGGRATDKLISDRFVWPGMHKDFKAWTRACPGCQRNKVQRNNEAPIGTIPISDVRFSHVHLDIVGPLPLPNGCSYHLTCVDRFTWLCSHLHYSLSSGSQRDGRAVSPPAEGLLTHRRRSGELDRPPPPSPAGIRSSLKSDLNCSAAELVLGATIRLHRQMISPIPRFSVEDPTNLLHRLRQFM